MDFLFDLNTFNEKIYKRIFQHLCKISDIIYFIYTDTLMINERIFELSEHCEQVVVPKRIRNQFNENIMGFKVNVFIELFIYEHENIFQLLEDRGYGRILFYVSENEIAYVGLTDFKDILFKTNDKILIEELSKIKD